MDVRRWGQQIVATFRHSTMLASMRLGGVELVSWASLGPSFFTSLENGLCGNTCCVLAGGAPDRAECCSGTDGTLGGEHHIPPGILIELDGKIGEPGALGASGLP